MIDSLIQRARAGMAEIPQFAVERVSRALNNTDSSSCTGPSKPCPASVSSAIGHVLLGATYEGTTSLVLPCGGRIAETIHFLGGQSSEGLPGALPLRPLPFRDDSFDSVFLDMEAAHLWCPELSRGRSATPLRLLLEECARVLKPGGRLVLTAPNRNSLWRLLRSATNPLRPKPQPPARTKGGYTRLLHSAGFSGVEHYIPWPDPSAWRQLIRVDNFIGHADFRFAGTGLKQKVGQAMFMLLKRLGFAAEFVASYCIIGCKPTVLSNPAYAAAAASTLELMVDGTGVSAEMIDEIASLPNSKCVSFSAGGKFIKVPIEQNAADQLRQESDTIARVARTAAAANSFVLDDVEFREAQGAAFMVYPYISKHRNDDWNDKVSRLDYALTRLAEDSHVKPVSETESWQRLFAPETTADLIDLGAEDVLDYLTEITASKTLPVGLVHGDLAWANVMRREDKRVIIIDWDRTDWSSPKFLDAVHACHSLTRTRQYLNAPTERGVDRAKIAWEMLATRDPGVPLLHRIDEVVGELDWGEIIGLALLNKVERQIRMTRPSHPIGGAGGTMVVNHLNLARRCLRTHRFRLA